MTSDVSLFGKEYNDTKAISYRLLLFWFLLFSALLCQVEGSNLCKYKLIEAFQMELSIARKI